MGGDMFDIAVGDVYLYYLLLVLYMLQHLTIVFNIIKSLINFFPSVFQVSNIYILLYLIYIIFGIKVLYTETLFLSIKNLKIL